MTTGESKGEGNGRKPGTFTSETARAAGLRSGAARRGETQASIPTDEEIEQALRRKAGKGDVQAARALVEMTRGRAPGVRSLNEDLLSLLSDAQLAQVEEWLGVGLATQEGASGALTEGAEA